MTTKDFYNLRWGQLLYHEGFKRMFVVLGWRTGKKTKTKALRTRPSFVSTKVVYFTADSAKELNITHL